VENKIEKELLQKAHQFYQDEFFAANLYYYFAQKEKDETTRQKFQQLRLMEQEHIKFWYMFLKKRGEEARPAKSRIKFSLNKLIRSLVGARFYVSFLEMTESSSVKAYYQFLTFEGLSEDEKEAIKKIIEDELEHEHFLEEKKSELPLANIRDFTLGMNDGLVELLGAVTGLSAVYVNNPFFVGISGLIVGIAGALSMGVGSFVSVRSQRQVNDGLSDKMKLLFKISPQRAERELQNKFLETGLEPQTSEAISKELAQNEKAAIGLLVEESQENELRSAFFTALAYIIGVAFPVLPYFVMSTSISALILSVILAGLVLSIVATVIALTAGISNVRGKILEMLLSGLGAAAISYIFGLIVQNTLGVSV